MSHSRATAVQHRLSAALRVKVGAATATFRSQITKHTKNNHYWYDIILCGRGFGQDINHVSVRFQYSWDFILQPWQKKNISHILIQQDPKLADDNSMRIYPPAFLIRGFAFTLFNHIWND